MIYDKYYSYCKNSVPYNYIFYTYIKSQTGKIIFSGGRTKTNIYNKLNEFNKHNFAYSKEHSYHILDNDKYCYNKCTLCKIYFDGSRKFYLPCKSEIGLRKIFG